MSCLLPTIVMLCLYNFRHISDEDFEHLRTKQTLSLAILPSLRIYFSYTN
jgi:hypothetical protein